MRLTDEDWLALFSEKINAGLIRVSDFLVHPIDVLIFTPRPQAAAFAALLSTCLFPLLFAGASSRSAQVTRILRSL